MNKKIILITGILFLLVIAGCDKFNIGKKAPITDVDVRTGIEGLAMEFLPNAPSDSIFAENDFPMAVRIRNKGAFSIGDEIGEFAKGENNGTLVFGLETAYIDMPAGKFADLTIEELRNLVPDFKRKSQEEFEGLNEQEREKYRLELINFLKTRMEFELEGKSIYNPNGGDDVITVDANANKIGEQSETQPSTILATACYPYETVFGASVCIDTDIYGISKGQKACSIQDLVVSNGQGAPVAVTKVETRMLPQGQDLLKPHFIIHVENKGNGQVVALEKVEQACSNEPLEYNDFNTIIVKAELSGKPLDCRTNRDDPLPPLPARVRLREKKDIIRCTLEPGGGVELIPTGRDSYVSPLKIELEYGYTFTISKNIIIEKVLTY